MENLDEQDTDAEAARYWSTNVLFTTCDAIADRCIVKREGRGRPYSLHVSIR